MTTSKPILISTFTTSLLVLAGCTQTTTNTSTSNQNTDTTVLTNTNETVANENTNTAEVDTSDWLTYTNEEYGFSFRYPNDYSFDESHEGVNFKHIESDSNSTNESNIKFYIQYYSEAPDNSGETYALLSTKEELSAMKDSLAKESDLVINGIPLNTYYSYDVPGDGFYKGADFFVKQDYVRVSMVIKPSGIEYLNHPFNDETREWAGKIVEQLNQGQLISKIDQERIGIFDNMIYTLRVQ